jgi:uncharacterized Zn ribbon protein
MWSINQYGWGLCPNCGSDFHYDNGDETYECSECETTYIPGDGSHLEEED